MGTVHQQHNYEQTLSSYGHASLLPHLLDFLRYSFLTLSDFISFGTMNRAKQTDHSFLQIKGDVCALLPNFFDDAIQAVPVHWVNSFLEQL